MAFARLGKCICKSMVIQLMVLLLPVKKSIPRRRLEIGTRL
jgi:hypothetical protein